ncbi:MAG: agmatinase [candidate division WOR-3 bacterium]
MTIDFVLSCETNRMTFDFVRADPAQASVVIVGVPLDRSSSFIPGTRFGPDAARLGSVNIESFSPYQKRDAAELAIADAGDVCFTFSNPDAPFEQIRSVTRSNIEADRKQLAVGGEHTITPAIVSELVRAHPDLCIVQFDAHSDLRDDFLGEKWCHATAMRRVLDFVPRYRLFQVGIRSFSQAAEMDVPELFAFDVLDSIGTVRQRIGSRPVYISLDVDVLDPSVLPDVQTPQPGGVTYQELAKALAGLAKLGVVGADIVEFCPRGPHPTAGAPVVAELVRELAIVLGTS